jgi:hypothetical protein
MKKLVVLLLAAGLVTVVARSTQVASADPVQARPVIDNDYLYRQLYYQATNFIYRVSGGDGPPNTTSSGFNLPPNVNGANEYYAWWKSEMTDPSDMGPLGNWVTAKDHFFNPSGGMLFQGNDAEVTIPGSTCPGQRVLIAGHNDGTPTSTTMNTNWTNNNYVSALGNMHGGNMGNGSPYDATSGEAMGMAELQALLKWWQANGTWPKRTIKVTLFDAEELGLIGSGAYSSTGASGLIPDGPQGQYTMVANMDQNGMEYPARHWGTDHYLNNIVGGNVGPWYTNVNAAPLVPNGIYSSSNTIFQATPHANVIAFRAVLGQAVSDAFQVLGQKYNFSMPLENPLRYDQPGSTPLVPGQTIIPAYLPSDMAAYSPVVDDALGRTDQVSFINRGIPGYGVVGAYDSSNSAVGGFENPYPAGYASKPTLGQYAGYDTTNDTIANLNYWTSGTVHGPDGPEDPAVALERALELPATWTTYTIQHDNYGGAVPAPSTPVAYFETSPVKPRTTLTVTFDASFSRNLSGGSSNIKYYWDFGDGTTGNGGPTITHTYAASRYADVKLLIVQGNKVGAYRQAVPVNFTAPNASFPAPATNPCGTLSQAEIQGVLAAVDTVPPVTAASLAPPAVNDWFVNPTVTLDATDNDSGVDTTEYNLDDTGFVPYTGPFQVTGDGEHTLLYHSTDVSANHEADKSLDFKIDATPPATTASIAPVGPGGNYKNPTVTLAATDLTSGVGTTEYRLDGGAFTPYAAPFVVTGDGPHTLDFRSTDVAGNVEATQSRAFVVDATPPVVTVSADIVKEATGADGATVTYDDATALDAIDGPVAATCTPASGTTFPLGHTQVHCTATDAAGNVGSASFDVFVPDTTAPEVHTAPNAVWEATGPLGAVVTFADPTAHDTVDGDVAASCAPPSLSTFALGNTLVTCSAADSAGNTGFAYFNILVVDTTAPVVEHHANIVANATEPGGTHVSFAVFADDLVDGHIPATCAPSSGSLFAMGHTAVGCSATDAHHNTGIAAPFDVYVKAPSVQIQELNALVLSFDLKKNKDEKFLNTLENSAKHLLRGQLKQVCKELDDFSKKADSESGKRLTEAQAAQLVTAAARISGALGCP